MKASLAIVGGGIIGHMIAARAIEANPSASILLIERDLPGHGATARSAGAHFPLGRSSAVREMSMESQRFYEDALARSPNLPIAPLPMKVHCSLSREPWLREVFTDGANLRRVDMAEYYDDPIATKVGIWAAAGAHQADVRAYVDVLRRTLRDWAVTLDGVKVAAIAEEENHVTICMSDGRAVEADRVVLAPGPWALEPEFQPFTGQLGVRIKKVLAFDLDGRAGSDRCLELFVEDDAFLMPHLTSSGLLFSYTSTVWDVSPVTVSSGVSKADRREAEQVLARNAPHLNGSLRGARVFCDAYSAGRIPIVETVGETGRIVFSGAANGSGYRLAPAIAARTLAKLGIGRQVENA